MSTHVLISTFGNNCSQVRIHNDSPQDVFARLYIDGQLVAQRLRRAHTAGTISSIPVNCKEQKELLFSLPRFPTVAEQAAGGHSLDPNKLSELGTIRYNTLYVCILQQAVCITLRLSIVFTLAATQSVVAVLARAVRNVKSLSRLSSQTEYVALLPMCSTMLL
jgi:hypothetical protein